MYGSQQWSGTKNHKADAAQQNPAAKHFHSCALFINASLDNKTPV
jgi:hypothetical protein